METLSFAIDSYHWTARAVPTLDVWSFLLIDMLILQCVIVCSMSVVFFILLKYGVYLLMHLLILHI